MGMDVFYWTFLWPGGKKRRERGGQGGRKAGQKAKNRKEGTKMGRNRQVKRRDFHRSFQNTAWVPPADLPQRIVLLEHQCLIYSLHGAIFSSSAEAHNHFS